MTTVTEHYTEKHNVSGAVKMAVAIMDHCGIYGCGGVVTGMDVTVG